MLYHAVQPLLFRLDAERAHRSVITALTACEALLSGARFAPRPWGHPLLAQRLWDLDFHNPIGLAAGFDKDAHAPHIWPLLGFGFVELGTITAEPQPGNPPPRLFRLPRDRGLINRLGFNNDGAAAVADRLHRLLRHLPMRIPLGINIGKSRRTPLAEAVDDYRSSLQHLWPFASYVVINVSSPNTPGLRDLQTEKHLTALLSALQAANAFLAQRHAASPRPLLIKVAPDLADDDLAVIVRVARAHGAAGLIATNTTISRDGLHAPTVEAGGLSGAPLRERATAVIRTLYRLAGPDLPIVGVGGVFTAADAYAKIRAGASLVQLYTAMVYEGPRLAYRVARGLVALLQRDGLTLRAAVGMDT